MKKKYLFYFMLSFSLLTHADAPLGRLRFDKDNGTKEYTYTTTEQLNKVKRGLESGRSLIIYPNPPGEHKFGYMDNEDNVFNIGKNTSYERLNRSTTEEKIKNPYRIGGIEGAFSIGGGELGRTLVLKQIGYYPTANQRLINHKASSVKPFGLLKFAKVDKELELVDVEYYAGDRHQTMTQITGATCDPASCSLTTKEIDVNLGGGGWRRGKQKQWVFKEAAYVAFDHKSSPIRLTVPEKSKIYITDMVMIQPNEAFAWNEKQCKNKINTDSDAKYTFDGEKFTECPLYGFNYKIIKGTEFLSKLQGDLLKLGWPQSMVSNIQYLPMTEVKNR